jgi:DNA-binding transcriptional MerR regulator
MLTISELAGFAGVTIRTVRHYHDRGLLPEPGRDASGYRRYDAQAVVDLIRIRTLAEAGVPLSRVSALLQADPEEFARAVEEIDRDLRAQTRRIQENRRRVASLVSGDGLALPPEVVTYLEMLRSMGLSERIVTIERDGWILLSARYPELVGDLIGQKAAAFDDEIFRRLYLMFDQSYSWSPDDPRIEVMADLMITYMTQDQERMQAALEQVPIEESLAGLLDAQAITTAPAWRRLEEVLIARGYKGWTNLSRIEPA